MKLLDNYDVFVDRTKLRVALQGARQKSPIFLLNKLIPLVFSEEELANSCGLGIHTTSTKSATSKQSIPKLPLDSYRVAACKGMMSKSRDIWLRGRGNVLACKVIIALHVALLVRVAFLCLPSFVLISPFCFFFSIHRIFDGVLHPKRQSISQQQGGEFGFHAADHLREGESR